MTRVSEHPAAGRRQTPFPTRALRDRRRYLVRRIVAATSVAVVVGGTFLVLRGDPAAPGDDALRSGPARGSPAWALEHYGDPDSRGFKRRNIVELDFLGRTMFVHSDARRHFLRLERLFEARAPDYAASVASGEVDDWSFVNRPVRGGTAKSSHAFGIAIDINALSNPLGSEGDMPAEVVDQWVVEGGAWGGAWSRPDPMHFETNLTPEEIRARYRADGTPRPWYLERLVGD
jgi:hypothetical protein